MFSWLPAISVAAPSFLVGISAGIIPVLIHLIYRRRAPQILFSTLRFIRISTQKTARRRRIEDLLLMLFRILLFSLLAAALAQPFIKSGGFITPNAAVTAVVILDNSMSMTYSEGGVTRYTRATRVAQHIVRDLLPAGSSVALLFSNPTETSQSNGTDELEFTTDRDQVYQAIAGSQPAAGKADLVARLTAAYKALREINQPNREIYLVTDMQEVSWEADWQATEEEDADRDISLIVFPYGTEDYKNVAVTDIELMMRGRAAGSIAVVRAAIENSSPVEQEDILAVLLLDGEKKAERTVSVPADSTSNVTFSSSFDTAGWHTGQVRLEVDDYMPADNSRGFSVGITDQIRVLIVKEKANPISFLDPAFYLAAALDPGISTGIGLTAIERKDLPGKKLRDYGVIFLVDLAELPAATAAQLEDYVRKGGGLVIFLGPNTTPKTYPDALKPARIGGAAGEAGDRGTYCSVAWVDFESPLFKPFKDVPFANFSGIHVRRFFELFIRRAGQTTVLAKLDTARQSPFLVEGRLGHGRILLFASTADVSWGNFPVRNLFLPIMHQVVYYLTEDETGRTDYTAGDPVTILTPDPNQAVEVTDPLGRTKRLVPNPDAELSGLVYRDTSLTGKYTWRTESPPVVEGTFIVNPPAEESNLSTLSDKDLAQKLAGTKISFAHDREELHTLLTQIREGIQLWNYMLIVVLGIAIIECFLANKKKPEARKMGRKITP